MHIHSTHTKIEDILVMLRKLNVPYAHVRLLAYEKYNTLVAWDADLSQCMIHVHDLYPELKHAMVNVSHIDRSGNITGVGNGYSVMEFSAPSIVG